MSRIGFFLLTVPVCVLASCNSGGGVAGPVNDTVSGSLRQRTDQLNAAAIRHQQFNIDSSGLYADSAFKMAEDIRYKNGLELALLNQSEYQRRKGNYELSLQKCFDGLDLHGRNKKDAYTGRCYIQIAYVYKETGGEKKTVDFLWKAVDYGKQSANIYSSIADSGGLANALSMQGISYRDLARSLHKPHFYDSSYQVFEKAIALIRTSGQGTEFLPKLYNNLSQYYLEYKEDIGKGLELLHMAVDLNQQQGNIMSMGYNYGNICQAYRKLNRNDSALYYARKTVTIAQQLHSPHRLMNAYNSLWGCFKSLHLYDSALTYMQLAHNLADSIANLEKTGQIAEMQTRFETKEKEAAILKLNASNKVKKQRLLVLGIVLIGLTSLAALLLWQYGRLQRKNQTIAKQSDQLNLLMRELHHRVKNNLQVVSSLLNLQTHRIKDADAMAAMNESRNRVQAMSLIHQRLYQQDHITHINMKEYITDLAEQLMASYGYTAGAFDLQLQIDHELVDIDKAMPLGLIINEILTNAFKYAYHNIERPVLFIKLASGNGQLTLDISDNGPGLDEQGWQQNRSASFGKQLIKALSKQLRATQQLNTTSGTHFTFTIPLAA